MERRDAYCEFVRRRVVITELVVGDDGLMGGFCRDFWREVGFVDMERYGVGWRVTDCPWQIQCRARRIGRAAAAKDERIGISVEPGEKWDFKRRS